jgi:hypothetical protein
MNKPHQQIAVTLAFLENSSATAITAQCFRGY